MINRKIFRFMGEISSLFDVWYILFFLYYQQTLLILSSASFFQQISISDQNYRTVEAIYWYKLYKNPKCWYLNPFSAHSFSYNLCWNYHYPPSSAVHLCFPVEKIWKIGNRCFCWGLARTIARQFLLYFKEKSVACLYHTLKWLAISFGV